MYFCNNVPTLSLPLRPLMVKRKKGARQKCAVKKAQDRRVLVQKRAKQKSARLMVARKKSARQMGARQKSADQLELLGLLYYTIHFRHVNFLFHVNYLLTYHKSIGFHDFTKKKASVYTFTHLKHCISLLSGLENFGYKVKKYIYINTTIFLTLL